MAPLEYRSLRDSAEDSYREGRFEEAALLYERAAQVAARHTLAHELFFCQERAANSWFLAGHPLKALTLLAEALLNIPPQTDPGEVFLAYKTRWYISLNTNPRAAWLREQLDMLEELSRNHPAIAGQNVPLLRGEFYEARGDWRAALEQAELAWARFDPKKWGTIKSVIPEDAILCNLHLGNIAAARHWRDLLEPIYPHKNSSDMRRHTSDIHIALAAQEFAQAEDAAERAEDLARIIQFPELQMPVYMLRIRTLLFDPHGHDPAQRTHPARHRLATLLRQRTQNVFLIYDRRLLLLDYHLATLRYAAGLPPVEDLWTRAAPEVMPDVTLRLPAEIAPRAARVRRALAGAQAQAGWLDERFECHCRQDEVATRRARLEAILQSVQGDNS